MQIVRKIRKIWDELISLEYSVYTKACAVALSVYGARTLYCIIQRKYNKYPPGPYGLPFIGSLLSCSDLAKYAAFLASSYGPVTMIYIGKQPFVFLHDIDSINEVFKNKNALGREWDRSLLFSDLKPYELETASASDPHWKPKRRIFQSVMLSYLDSTFINNVHNQSLETHVFKSIHKCIEDNKLWYPFDDISYLQFHSIWNAAFGSHVPFDSKHKKIVKMVSDELSDASIDMIVRYVFFQKMLPSYFIQSLSANYKNLNQYLEEQIYEQLGYDKAVFDMNNKKWDSKVSATCDQCIVSKLLNMHRKNPTIYSTKKSIITDINLLFQAGVDTSINTTEYGLILLAKYPKQQTQISEELTGVFGNDILMEKVKLREVIHKLHYLRAFIYELLRLSSVVPAGVAHFNPNCDIWLNNGKVCIPKESVIISDVATANRNDLYWSHKTKGEPMNLCLEAWLDQNHHFKSNLNRDKMVGFGVGPRDCAGKSFALRSLYLIFAKLILKYELAFPQKDQNIPIKQVYQFTSVVEPKIGLKVTDRIQC